MYLKNIVGLCCLFAAGAVMGATTVVSQPFAEKTDDLTKIVGDRSGTWSGSGAVVSGDGAAYTLSAGLPISGGTALENVLRVDSSVMCAVGATASKKPVTLEMMLQVAKSGESLPASPDQAEGSTAGEDASADNIQIAVGIDADGSLKAYCTDKSGKVGWCRLCEGLEEGSWHRMGFTFDYASGLCQISLDGVALVTENGYISTNPGAEQAELAGSWYKLKVGEKLATVEVVGSTSIDEVVVQAGDAVADVLPAPGGEVNGVSQAWLLAQGVTDATAAAPDGSKMTVAQKYRAGLQVLDGEAYKIKGMAMSGDAGRVKATLAVPKMTPPAGYRNVVKFDTDPGGLDTTANRVEVKPGAEAVELDVPGAGATSGEGAVRPVTKVYYKMVSEPVTASAE